MASEPSSSTQPLLHSPNSSQPRRPPSLSSSSTSSRTTLTHLLHPFRPIRLHAALRIRTHAFLISKYQHYVVLSLVSLDLLSIFADIIINLYQCDKGEKASPKWDDVRQGLGVAGLVFSCMFMVELVGSVWAFGFRYFNSTFHIFDATVILLGFIIDILLRGVLEEIASLVVVLRLWRFFKIIEEFSVGAEEQMDGLEMRIEQLESENGELKRELRRRKGAGDEEEGGNMQGAGGGWE
ncbi:hypothetical protein B0J14DRAFT_666259 [Halenospora varia]|nr:hypothetical protein B0J14DRAFT_666259 [Halenospora varia]